MQGQKRQLKILDLLDDPEMVMCDAISLRNLAKESPQEHEDKLVSYLENGTQLFCTLLAVFDYLSNEEKFVGDPSIKTDGTWFWRQYLAYFVKTYHFRLPQEFVDHAKSNNWKVPEIRYEQEKPLIEAYRELRRLRGNEF